MNINFKKRVLFPFLFLSLFFSCETMTVFAQQKGGIKVIVEPQSGKYIISSNILHWTFEGSIGQSVSNVRNDEGKDAGGAYKTVSFSWNSGADYTAVIRWYQEKPVVIFSLGLPQGSRQPLAAFPDFSGVPAALHHFSFQDIDFATPGFQLYETSTPWLLFNDNMDACIISPASDFIVAKLSGNGNNISSSVNAEIKQFPANFSHTTIMVLSNGISKTWDEWGSALRTIYNRIRPANDADDILKYYGYWTDNGADYYYNYDTAKGYAGTLLALRQHYKEEGIPLGYMQLDSWWYEKSVLGPKGEINVEHKNPKLPPGPWNRYGGLMEYRADPFLFPDGLADFQKKLGLPIVTHNRWIDPESPYQKMYKISGVAGIDSGYWNDIMGYIKDAGIMCYEQDWLNYIYNKTPEMISTLNVGNEFTDAMAKAAKEKGIDVQYCMAMPRYFLQGVKYNNLTNIRTSPDRFEEKKWMPFIFVSQLAYEMGIWPWCDVFKSSETGNMIISVLSAGPVGTGDAIGRENKNNIMMACRNDGVLVKPDVPLLPFDKDYVQMANDEHMPISAYTYTKHGSVTTGYVFAFANKNTTSNDFGFTPADMGMKGDVVIFNPANKTTATLKANKTFNGTVPPDKYVYYIVAPVTTSGIAFLGDAGKIAATGKKRIADISSTGNSLQVKVLFARGETAVTLQGYAIHAVSADIGNISMDNAAHLFTLTVPAPQTGNSIVINLKTK